MKRFANEAVKARFDGYSTGQRASLLALREEVFAVAADTPGVGKIEEALNFKQVGESISVTLEPDDAFGEYDEKAIRMEALADLPPDVKVGGSPMPDSLDALSRVAIRRVLDDCAGNVSQAARRLGISRQTLYRKLRD